MKGKLILLIEDNKKVQNYNKRMLTEEGFAVESALTLADAKAFLAQRTPDIIVLDVGMPDGNGIDFLREFRQTSKIPVLMLTGYGENKDIVLGFNTGCDDYLIKPYTFDILLVRLNRLLKSTEQVPDVVIRGLLTLKFTPMTAYLNGKDLILSQKEFTLLLFFIQNENRVMSAEYLYENVWGASMAGDDNVIKVTLSKLRKKISGSGYTIVAEYGEGYRFERI